MGARHRRSSQTAGPHTASELCRAHVTLAVHPLYGGEIVVLAKHGEQVVRAETADGKLRHVPLDWTSQRFLFQTEGVRRK